MDNQKPTHSIRWENTEVLVCLPREVADGLDSDVLMVRQHSRAMARNRFRRVYDGLYRRWKLPQKIDLNDLDITLLDTIR